MNRFYKLFIFILPALVTFLVYIPALGAGFVNWDDPKYVYENPYITELDAFFFKFAFTSFYFANWHPLTLISYAVDYALWGDRPFGYHLTNNILHSVNTGLVALLAFRLTSLSSAKHGSRTVPIAAALISAALFGLHPIHVESAAWISERKDLLCALFLFLAALSYLRYAPSGRMRWYGASLFFFALSLMSKPMAITFPFILLILDFYPLERIRVALGRILIEKLPFLALSAASAILTMLAQKGEGALTALGPIPFLMRAAVALRGLAFYIFKTVFPAGLAPSQDAADVLTRAVSWFEKEGITAVPVWRVGHTAGETIAHTSGELGVGYVVIGTSRRTPLWKLLRGSVLRELSENLRPGTQLVVVH